MDNVKCCHTEAKAVDQTCHLTQSQCPDKQSYHRLCDAGRLAGLSQEQQNVRGKGRGEYINVKQRFSFFVFVLLVCLGVGRGWCL